MSYSMSYTWYDVTCNVGICKSKSTLRDTSYHIRRMTGWALSCCGMRVAGCALYHKVVLHCDVTPRYAVTSLRVTLSRDFSPERHSSIRNIHVKLRYPTSTLGRSRLCVSVYFYHTKQTYLTCNMVWLNPWQYTVNPAWIYIKSCFEKSCPFGFIISWRICSRVSYLLFYYLRFSLNLLASEFYI